jgi:hypothetical protein
MAPPARVSSDRTRARDRGRRREAQRAGRRSARFDGRAESDDDREDCACEAEQGQENEGALMHRDAPPDKAPATRLVRTSGTIIRGWSRAPPRPFLLTPA